MLQEIVSYHQPESWQSASYAGRRYQLYDVLPGDAEYQQVVSSFAGLAVGKVQRVQNPFVFGRWKIKKEYLELSGCARESTAYHPISVAEVAKVAEFNCDVRRYANKTSAQTSDKNPTFYSTAAKAESHYKIYSSGALVIVVVRLLNADPSWDSCYWPEYFVYID